MNKLSSKQESSLIELREKEKQSYIAFSALIDFLQGHQKHIHIYKPTMNFDEYKQSVLSQAAKLKWQGACSGTLPENQFNVMHYQRAILSASQINYRNMAILAAMDNLTPSALSQLVTLIKKTCIKLSKDITTAERKLLFSHGLENEAVVISHTP